LNHGKKFNKYKSKMYKNGNEGFLVPPSKAVLEETSITRNQNELDVLQREYNKTLEQYQKLEAKISGNTEDYYKRINPTNQYLNKTVRFSTGQTAYVTNQGVVRIIPSLEIGVSVNAPPSSLNLQIPWDESYVIPNTPIPTSPPLISGTPMKKGQSIGFEGQNVYVDRLITNSTAEYLGCYADTQSMTFIGNSPSVISAIFNGEFSQPQIDNNSYTAITSTSTVPGWDFNAFLINNSSAWGYPIPYPVGDQCVSIQTGGTISQGLANVSAGTYSLTFYACGRNCCDNSGKSNPINVLLNNVSIYSIDNPVINVWTKHTTTFSVTQAGSSVITFKGTWTESDRSTALQGISIGNTDSNSAGSFNYDMCKQSAIDGGYQYFALQNVNTETSKGYCGVSNDSVGATKGGLSYAVSGVTGLWSSATSGQPGNTAYLNSAGSLEVLNSSGTVVYSTPGLNPTNYMGCYKDASARAIPLYNKGSQSYTKDSCHQLANDSGNTYYGTQNSSTGKNAQCSFSNDFAHVTMYGKANNCYKLSDGSWSGGPWSNAVYTADPEQKNNYFLSLQDDGNMCIYRGVNPSDWQEGVWCAYTNGQQKEANPQYQVEKGKFGRNWMSTGSTLASGEFIASNNGKIFLIMNSDGNLVLYTSTKALNCKQMSDTKTGGGQGGNALYKMNQTGIKSNLKNIAYIDQNSDLFSYPDEETELSNAYSELKGTDTVGNDLTSFGGANVDSCKSACNNTDDCYGFVFVSNTGTCYTKDKNISDKQLNPTSDLYIRSRKPKNQPASISQIVNNVDSIKYQNYTNSGKDISSVYGLDKANYVQKQELDQLKGKMNLLSKQMVDMTSNLKKNGGLVGARIQTNTQTVEGFTNGVQGGYLTQLRDTNKRITEYTTNLDHIVDDSKTVFLQHNYEYLLWSVIALGTGIMALSVIRN